LEPNIASTGNIFLTFYHRQPTSNMTLKKSIIPLIVLCFWAFFLMLSPMVTFAKPKATIKFTTIRTENPKLSKETLVIPYGFPSDSLGTTFGIGGMTKGYGQDQLLTGGTVFYSGDEAAGIILGLWDFKLPSTERLFFSAVGSIGDYPRLRAYAEHPSDIEGVRAGSNDSDKDDYIEDQGTDNWWEMKLEYVLPIGSMKNSGMATYKLDGGLLTNGASGSESWNPLESGATVLVLRQSNRYQKYETEKGNVSGTIHPLEFGILYNNTDFQSNPSTGSSQYFSLTHDFAWLESEQTWTFLEFEASKYFSLGSGMFAKQRVVALNFWTGDALSWESETGEDGLEAISHKPPFLEGARLGGFYRMRAYPNNRFNDRSVIYSTAEYRHTLEWNPIGEVSWLRWLKMDWMQLVGFVEGGRVAGEYDVSELFSDWKYDAGIGFRTMLAGGVVRFDIAFSEESSAAVVMFGHPF